MCRDERVTTRRGRTGVPETRLRTRVCRRSRAVRRLALAVRLTAMIYLLLPGLSDLAADDLALVPHALALVRVGLAQATDLGGDLADQLLVDAVHDEAGRGLHLEPDALRGLHRHRVAVTERELQVGTLGLHAVTDADDLQRLRVARGDADDHVRDQCPGQSVQRARVALVVGALDDDLALFLGDRDRLGDSVREGALGALDGHLLAVEGDLDAARDRDRQTADARHLGTPYQT